MKNTLRKFLGKISSVFVITAASLLMLIGPTLSWAVDLGNGFSLSNLTYLDFTNASGDLVDTSSDKDISPGQGKTNRGLADGFHFTRVYFTLTKDVNDQLSFRITTDQMTVRPDGSTEGSPFGLSGYGGAGRGNMFIKFVYAQYKFSPELMIRAGLTQTPWIATAEERWTLRFLRPTFWDEQGVLTSSDLGVSAIGGILNNLVSYHLMFSNGEGYQNNSVDGRGYAGQGRIDLNVLHGLTLSAFGLAETVHNGVQSWNPTREIFYAMYTHEIFRIAAEYMLADDKSEGNSPALAIMTTPGSASGSKGASTSGPRFDQAKGYGSWAWVRIPGIEALRVFGRFYTIKPNTTTNAGKTTEFNAGISYDISKELIVAIDDTMLSQKLLRVSTGDTETFKDNIIGLRAQLSF
ncbi:MAG: hypothetical protein HY282_02830 [Nitrospirae bacterium]|nr:hypothetical protein [Candidatus Manganitrophaceae bacterium]